MKLVSAVMPTRSRSALAAMAVECFLNQTYSAKHLIIIDDEDGRSFPTGITHPLITYRRENIRYNIPQKLNMACEMATGEVIVKWDSDDWYCRTRIEEQVHRLEQTGLAVTGYRTCLFYEEETGKAYEYRITPAWALGTSLTFLRSWWQRHRFMEKKFTGSDNQFCREALAEKQLDSIEGRKNIVARIHSGNTNHGKREQNYHAIDASLLPAAFPRMVPVG